MWQAIRTLLCLDGLQPTPAIVAGRPISNLFASTRASCSKTDKDLTHKRALLRLSEPAVRTREPLTSQEAFYRNCDKLRDNPHSLDKKTLTLTCIYKFARRVGRHRSRVERRSHPRPVRRCALPHRPLPLGRRILPRTLVRRDV
jgi:hypothetical protein